MVSVSGTIDATDMSGMCRNYQLVSSDRQIAQQIAVFSHCYICLVLHQAERFVLCGRAAWGFPVVPFKVQNIPTLLTGAYELL